MVRICVIGAGPCGLAALYQFGRMDPSPELVCFEKQDTWGGLWNFTWRTGIDQYGEPNHGGMYRYLWSNGPKECIEFPDYTFEQHFKKAIPSFPPRAVLRDYLEGRWKSSKVDLSQFVKLHHVVRNVQYRQQSDDFLVSVENLAENKQFQEVFSHVIVATGIFNVPDVPTFNGIEQFNGRIIHSHDFRDAREFQGQRLLVVGASYSAEDIALQCLKYGATSVICTWRTKPMGFKFPKGISERPLLQRLNGKEAHFKDGSTAEVDCIIFCTGYKYHFLFMDNNLRLISKRRLYPDNLYKGTLWLEGGNNKVFYLGVQVQYYTYTMFDAQALWACKYVRFVGFIYGMKRIFFGSCRYIMRQLKDEPQIEAEMRKDVSKWRQKEAILKDCHDEIAFQTDFLEDLCKATDYDLRCVEAKEMLDSLLHDKVADIVTYRDQSYTSIFTKTPSPKHEAWFTAFDDSLDGFVKL